MVNSRKLDTAVVYVVRSISVTNENPGLGFKLANAYTLLSYPSNLLGYNVTAKQIKSTNLNILKRIKWGQIKTQRKDKSASFIV